MLTSRKRIILMTIIATTGVAVAITAFIFESSGVANLQIGGGGVPAAHLRAALESLPLPPRTTVYQADVTTGEEINAFYWAHDEPKDVVAFYALELPSNGWVVEQEPTVEMGHAKADGTQVSAVVGTFVKDDLQVRITATYNMKDPRRGAARLHVLVETGDQ
jgi:hypothetical protein